MKSQPNRRTICESHKCEQQVSAACIHEVTNLSLGLRLCLRLLLHGQLLLQLHHPLLLGRLHNSRRLSCCTMERKAMTAVQNPQHRHAEYRGQGGASPQTYTYPPDGLLNMQDMSNDFPSPGGNNFSRDIIGGKIHGRVRGGQTEASEARGVPGPGRRVAAAGAGVQAPAAVAVLC